MEKAERIPTVTEHFVICPKIIKPKPKPVSHCNSYLTEDLLGNPVGLPKCFYFHGLETNIEGKTFVVCSFNIERRT